MNLREVREAAELHREGIKADIDVVVDYALATIDPSPDEPITADWLREAWGWSSYGKMSMHYDQEISTTCFALGQLSR